MYNKKLTALAQFLEVDESELKEEYENCYSLGNQEYLVYTDEEADEAWNEQLEQYIDDCVLPEIPEAYRYYFDHEAYKEDCKHDGRGHSISSYDGNEEEIKINDTYYYIYRIN